MFDLRTVRRFYRKLLTLYPQAFREKFSGSMEQSFNDLYNERTSQVEHGFFGFVLWMVLEAGIGILREHILVLRQRDSMKNILTNHNWIAIASLILALPLGLTYIALMFNIEPLARLINNLFTIDGQQGELEINMLGRIVIYGGLLLLPVAFVLNPSADVEKGG